MPRLILIEGRRLIVYEGREAIGTYELAAGHQLSPQDVESVRIHHPPKGATP